MSTSETMRAWAKGAYDCEAGVELLIRSGLAERFAVAACWIDGSLEEDRARDVVQGPWSGGERSLLRLGFALAGVDPQIGIADVLSGLDRRHLHLALAALAHAAGSHQHSDVTSNEEGLPSFGGGYLAPLLDWPA